MLFFNQHFSLIIFRLWSTRYLSYHFSCLEICIYLCVLTRNINMAEALANLQEHQEIITFKTIDMCPRYFYAAAGSFAKRK